MMTAILVPLAEERLERLKCIAQQAGVSPEELARASLEEWLARPREDFAEAARQVMQKNAELYRRLA
jgi:antitoxin FitA